MDDLRDGDGPMIEEILDMDVDGLECDDEVSEGRFSRLAGERTVEPQSVLETAKRLKANFRQEVQAPKVASSSEQATARAEDPVAEFQQNIAFKRETLPQGGGTATCSSSA